MFEATLPMTRQDLPDSGGKGRTPISQRTPGIGRTRRRQGGMRLDPRTLLVIFLAISSLGMMLALYVKLGHTLPKPGSV